MLLWEDERLQLVPHRTSEYLFLVQEEELVDQGQTLHDVLRKPHQRPQQLFVGEEEGVPFPWRKVWVWLRGQWEEVHQFVPVHS